MWCVIRWGNGDIIAKFQSQSEANDCAAKYNGTAVVQFIAEG